MKWFIPYVEEHCDSLFYVSKELNITFVEGDEMNEHPFDITGEHKPNQSVS